MKCVVVDMRNRLFGDAISGSLQHFDSGFRVYQTEGTAAEDLCVDTHADVLVAEVTAYPPWRLEQRLDLCRRLRQGLPGCRVALVRETMLNHTMMSSAMACASGERLNRDTANRLAKKNADRFITHAPQ